VLSAGFLCNALYLDSVLLYMLVLSYVIVVIKRVSYQGRLEAARTWSIDEGAFNGIIEALHTQRTRRKEAGAPVKTDQGLIHTHEDRSSRPVPERERTAKKKLN